MDVEVVRAPDNAQALERLHSYVVLDTETTGQSSTDEIVEIAILTVTNDKITDEYSTLIKPTVRMSPMAQAVNGITDAELETAPVIDDVLPDIIDRIDGKIIIGHNVTFDLRFLARALRRYGCIMQLSYVDTVTLSRRCYKSGSHKLQDMATRLGIDPGHGHRALDDTRTTKALYDKCAAMLAKVEAEAARQREKEQREALARIEADLKRRKEEQRASCWWSPLLDKKFVFTGDFLTYRSRLESLLDEVGADLCTMVDGGTNYLVCGDLSKLPEWARARKAGIADIRIASGQPITKLTEGQYIDLIRQTLLQKEKAATEEDATP